MKNCFFFPLITLAIFACSPKSNPAAYSLPDVDLEKIMAMSEEEITGWSKKNMDSLISLGYEPLKTEYAPKDTWGQWDTAWKEAQNVMEFLAARNQSQKTKTRKKAR